MTSQKPKDPLDVLQDMVNDVLVHTGKALRASRKDSQGNLAQAHAAIQPKISESIYTFHCALDTLDMEIIKAKSIIQRDQNLLREQKQQLQQKQEAHQQQQVQQKQKHQPPAPVMQQPQPVESQSKEQLVIDLDSSPPPPDHPMPEPKMSKSQAPFPDMGMGMGMPELGHGDVIVKGNSPILTRTPTPATTNQFKQGPVAATAPMAPMPDMEEKPMDMNMDMSGGISNQELNFTNMEFTLAPTNNDGQSQPTTQDPSFDLTTFAPSDPELMAFVNPMPPDSNEHSQAGPVSQAPASGMAMQTAISIPDDSDGNKHSNNNNNNPNNTASAEHGMGGYYGTLRKEETDDSTFKDILMDDGDEGFGNVGGMGEETFDDLIAVRDEPFDVMEHGDFDATYFGLSNA